MMKKFVYFPAFFLIEKDRGLLKAFPIKNDEQNEYGKNITFKLLKNTN